MRAQTKHELAEKIEDINCRLGRYRSKAISALLGGQYHNAEHLCYQCTQLVGEVADLELDLRELKIERMHS